jgi:hypothetical protein
MEVWKEGCMQQLFCGGEPVADDDPAVSDALAAIEIHCYEGSGGSAELPSAQQNVPEPENLRETLLEGLNRQHRQSLAQVGTLGEWKP